MAYRRIATAPNDNHIPGARTASGSSKRTTHSAAARRSMSNQLRCDHKPIMTTAIITSERTAGTAKPASAA
jgi:hypothetical protein